MLLPRRILGVFICFQLVCEYDSQHRRLLESVDELFLACSQDARQTIFASRSVRNFSIANQASFMDSVHSVRCRMRAICQLPSKLQYSLDADESLPNVYRSFKLANRSRIYLRETVHV